MGVTCLVSMSCNGHRRVGPSIQELLIDSAHHVLEIPSRGLHSAVIAGRFTADGRHVVVLRSTPPFVTVFARDGSLRREFLNKGGGPDEMSAPYALATKGDSTVLVGDITGSFREYDLDGRSLSSGRLEVRAISLAASCGSKWLLFGPKRAQASSEADWLHEFSLSAGSEAVELKSWHRAPPGPGWIQAYGRPHGLTENEGRVTLVMNSLNPPLVAEWECSQERFSSTVIAGWEDLHSVVTAPSEKEGALRVMVGSRVATGVAQMGEERIFSGIVMGETPSTVFRVESGEERRPLTRATGAYILLDTKLQGGVLFSDPENGTIFAIDLDKAFKSLREE